MKSIIPKPKIEISKRTKAVIGIACAVLLTCFIICIVFFGYFACFPQNERLVIDSIRLAGPSKYWNPADTNESYKRRTDITDALDLELGKTHMFDFDAKQYVQTLLEKFPSLDSASVYRELPNRVVFDLRERIPIAHLRGTDAYLDEKGIVVAKNQFVSLEGSVPDIILIGDNARPLLFRSGDDLSKHASLSMARDLIKIVSLNITDIHITQLVVYLTNSSMDCTFLYKDDPVPFTATFPDRRNAEQLENDLLPRLLAVLRTPELYNNPKRKFIFRWEDSVVIPN